MAGRSHANGKTIFAAILITTAVALLSPVGLMGASVHADSLPLQVFSTAIGQMRRVVLGEHLIVHLNTATSLTVTEAAQLCEAVMDRGEALFELKAGSAVPLRVVVGTAVVSSRTSTFSMRLRETKDVDLVVGSGQVTVGTVIVGERTFARLSSGGMVLRELSEADVKRRYDWTARHVTFVGETLAEAIGEFNRYNTQKLVIADRTISSRTIGGRFSTTDVDSLIAALRPLGIRPMKGDTSKSAVIRLVSSQEAD